MKNHEVKNDPISLQEWQAEIAREAARLREQGMRLYDEEKAIRLMAERDAQQKAREQVRAARAAKIQNKTQAIFDARPLWKPKRKTPLPVNPLNAQERQRISSRRRSLRRAYPLGSRWYHLIFPWYGRGVVAGHRFTGRCRTKVELLIEWPGERVPDFARRQWMSTYELSATETFDNVYHWREVDEMEEY